MFCDHSNCWYCQQDGVPANMPCDPADLDIGTISLCIGDVPQCIVMFGTVIPRVDVPATVPYG